MNLMVFQRQVNRRGQARVEVVVQQVPRRCLVVVQFAAAATRDIEQQVTSKYRMEVASIGRKELETAAKMEVTSFVHITYLNSLSTYSCSSCVRVRCIAAA